MFGPQVQHGIMEVRQAANMPLKNVRVGRRERNGAIFIFAPKTLNTQEDLRKMKRAVDPPLQTMHVVQGQEGRARWDPATKALLVECV